MCSSRVALVMFPSRPTKRAQTSDGRRQRRVSFGPIPSQMRVCEVKGEGRAAPSPLPSEDDDALRPGVQWVRRALIVRVGTDSTIGTKFYFPCPNCRLPIRGFARGDDAMTFDVS